MASPARIFTITELRRTGAGVFEATPQAWRWDASSRTAPHGEIENELQIKTVRQEYPGADEPTEQVLHASWQPFELEGAWDNRHAGPGYAMDTYREFGRFVARAPLVRMELEEWSITGLITSLVLRYNRADRIGWKLTVSQHRHDTVGSTRSSTRITSPTSKPVREHVAEAQALAAGLVAANDAARAIPVSDSTLIEEGERLELLDAGVTRLVSSSGAGLETEAGQKLLAFSGQFRALGEAALSVTDVLVPVRSGAQVAFDDAIWWLRFDEHVHQSAADARALASLAFIAEADMRVRADARPIAIHRARAGESWYRISERYYGTPSEWRRIYEANGLQSMILDGTEELIVPERAA